MTKSKFFVTDAVCLLLLFSLPCILSCRPAAVGSVVIPLEAVKTDVQPVKHDPLDLPSDTTDRLYDGLIRKKALLGFYQVAGNMPVWLESGQPSALADSLFFRIQNLRYDGLIPRNYHADELSELDLRSPTRENLLRRDVLLTDAFLAIAGDIRDGRVSSNENIMGDSLNVLLLAKVLQEGKPTENLELLEPQYAGYRVLKSGLRNLLDHADIRERRFLMAGVRIDSSLLDKKIRRVEINLERWRREKNKVDERYILINIPSFILRLYSHDTVLLESRVIVGKPENPTPVLSSVVQCFVTYPYWHVPRKISVEELLPIIKKDTSYLARNNFDVLDKTGKTISAGSLDWATFSSKYFPISLRQREGAENSLGVIKFIFDNPYAVFLHDTNAKWLFNSEVRTFSHGCIRMEEAVDLAHFLVTGEIGERSGALDKRLSEKMRHTVELPYPIPIYVRYFTAEYKGNDLYQYRDVYGKDQDLIKLFYKPEKETLLLE